MEKYKDWIKAGKIAKEALEFGRTLIKPEAKLLDVAEAVENKIMELGAKPAFPVNLSLNDIAAHYTPAINDETIFGKSVVKIDVGVHVNGAIGDTALTVDLTGNHTELLEASKEALANALQIVKPGIKTSEIGKAIHSTITSKGYSPIVNLSGHGLEKFEVHTSPSIPNFDTGSDLRLKKGDIIAIEPFATNGAGKIKESSNPNIYSLIYSKPVRSPYARKILSYIEEEYETLPFADRWLTKKFSTLHIKLGIRELLNVEAIKSYPPLPDMNKGLVSQFEHTIIVDDDIIVTNL